MLINILFFLLLFVGSTIIKGQCRIYSNPYYNFGSFDNFYESSLLVFVVFNLEGWSDIGEKKKTKTEKHM